MSNASDSDISFAYIGVSQNLLKPTGVNSINVIAVGGCGGNNAMGTLGGKGAYVWTQYTNINQDISFDIIINVGKSGGNATINGYGAGGLSSDISGTSLFMNAGDGTVYNNVYSAGGGSATSIFFRGVEGVQDPILCIAGGGGGAGTGINSRGGHAYSFKEYKDTLNSLYSNGGETLQYSGGGIGGNINGIEEGGIGTVYGGCNGYDFLKGVNAYRYGIGGGGGDGGYIGGGGGGAGYGGGGGGNRIFGDSAAGGGGGGGAGSITNSSIYYFTTNEINPAWANNNGYVIISYNSFNELQTPINSMYMLNPINNNNSLYYGPDKLPSAFVKVNIGNSVPLIQTPNVDNVFNASTILSSSYGIYTNFNGGIYSFKDGTQTNPSGIKLRWTVSSSNSGNIIPFKNLPILSKGEKYIISADTSDNIVLITDNSISYSIVKSINSANMIDISYIVMDDGDNIDNIIVKCRDYIFVYRISQKNIIYQISYNIPNVYSVSIYNDNLNSYIVYATRTYIGKITGNYASNGVDVSGSYVIVAGGEEITTKLTLDDSNNVYFGTNHGKIYSYSLSGMNLNAGWPVSLAVDPSYCQTMSDISVDLHGSLLCVLKSGLYVINIFSHSLTWVMEKYNDPLLPNTFTKCFPAVIDAANNVYYTIDSILYSINVNTRTQNWHYNFLANATPISNVVISYNNSINFDDNTGDFIKKNGIIMINVLSVDSVSGLRTPSMYEFYKNGSLATKKTHILSMSGYNTAQTNTSNYFGPSNTTTTVTETKEKTSSLSLNIVSSNSYVLPSSSVDNSSNIIVSTLRNTMYIVDESLNKVATELNVSSSSMLTTPTLLGNNTICINAANKIISLDMTGNARWAYNTGGGTVYSSAIVDSADVIYFGSVNKIFAIGDGGIFGYNKWLHTYILDDVSGNIVANITLDESEKKIIFGTDAGDICCLSSVEGTLVWNIKLPDSSIYAPVGIDRDGNYLISVSKIDNTGNINTNTNNNEIHSYTSDGALNWTSSISNTGPLYNGVAYNSNNNVVYVGSILGLFAIDCANGNNVGLYNNHNFIYFGTPVIDPSYNIYVCSMNVYTAGVLHRLNHDTSNNSFTAIYNKTVSANSRLSWPTISRNNTIFVSSDNGKVYKIR